MVTETIGN